MMKSSTRQFALAVAGVFLPVLLAAQGNLSTQGFGFPQGQLSTRALATGGSIGELDQTTPLNPASIGLLTNRTVLFQIEPEYRTLTSASGVEHTTTDRYPVVFAGVPFGERWVTSVSSSTLLDRSWSTTTSKYSPIGATDSVFTIFNESSNGAINDLRVAESWTNRSWLLLGVGLHGITGRNVVTTGRDFTDTTEFSAFAATRTVSYSGSAVSAGAQFIAKDIGVMGVTYRKGGHLRTRAGDSTLAQADVPDHFGVSLAYTGVTGSIFAIRAAHENWSTMQPLIEGGGHARDSWDLSGGAEVAGPKFNSQIIMLRGGFRTRTLPFDAVTSAVTEKSLSGGSGFAMARGRVSVDATLVRQWRDSSLPSVRERAWTLSLSITARP